MDPIEADPEPLDPARLAAMTEPELADLLAALDGSERQLRRELAPLQARLADLAKRQAVVATERRRRERQQQLARRREVREQVKEGQAPSLRDLAEAADPPSSASRRWPSWNSCSRPAGRWRWGTPAPGSPASR